MTRFAPGVTRSGSTRGRTAIVLSCVGCGNTVCRFKAPTIAVCGPCRDAFHVSVYRYCHEVLGVAKFDCATYIDHLYRLRDSADGVRAVVLWARGRVAA